MINTKYRKTGTWICCHRPDCSAEGSKGVSEKECNYNFLFRNALAALGRAVRAMTTGPGTRLTILWGIGSPRASYYGAELEEQLRKKTLAGGYSIYPVSRSAADVVIC